MKIPSWVFDEALQLGGEEEVGADVVAIGGAVVGSIAHGEGEGQVSFRGLEIQPYFFERLYGFLVGLNGNGDGGDAVINIEKSLRQDGTVVIDEFESPLGVGQMFINKGDCLE